MFSPLQDALDALAGGGFVVVVDDESRENEGDLILAADKATPEALAFMVRYTSGVICAALPGHRLAALELPLMVRRNEDSHQTAFTITVDYRWDPAQGRHTGISASDRAQTLRALADPGAVAGDFTRPGHVFPLRARPGGVLERPGHTEAAVDLARLAGCEPVGVLCEIVREDGEMARRDELRRFAREHRLPIIAISDLIAYRLAQGEGLPPPTVGPTVLVRYPGAPAGGLRPRARQSAQPASRARISAP